MELILILFIAPFFLIGWIYGSIKEAKEKKEREHKIRIIKGKLYDIERKYPRALYAKFQKAPNSLSDWDLLKLDETPEYELSKLETFEEKKEADKFYGIWAKRQNEFSDTSRNASIKNWGCYSYIIKITNHLTSQKTYDLKVWNHFCEGYYDDPDLDYSTRPGTIANAAITEKLKNCTRYFYERIYDNLEELISQFEDKITILVADSELGNEAETFNNYHLAYLKSKLDSKVDWMTISEYLDLNIVRCSQYILILEVVSSYDSIIKNCNLVLNHSRNWQKTTGVRHPNLPNTPVYSTITVPYVTYVSLMKKYSKDEIEKLIQADKNRLEEKRVKEAEKARLEALEAQKREQERIEKERQEQERIRKEAEEKEKRRTAGNRLKQCTDTWYYPNKANLKCYSMYYYYPTTCEFSASQIDWDIRNLIWDFKANPNKPMPIETIIELHKNATDEIIKNMYKCLEYFFSDDVKYLTLACVPSSKEVINKRRFQDFSELLCKKASMENGFEYIKVTSDGDAKHMGGASSSSYEVDSEFFKGKHVLLFDDVITSGKSMERLRVAIQNAGANVIGGFSIGRTRHEKQGNHPFYVLGQKPISDPLDNLPF